ncbi:MAG: carboxylesterase family protein, partial [Salinivirgaceae bacterium]
MRGIIYLIAISVISIMYSCSTLPPEQVKVEQGIVQGYIEDGLRIFKGIPFAAPPVGELRWKAPQPAEKWEGVKQTTEFAPASVQFVNQPYGINEDCLYLNVWTPAKSSNEKLAVLVWIHGGGFSIGSTGEALSDCKALAHKDVVVVSIAYRLGQLGFLAHPELSAESPDGVSGNYGLLDQIAALRWIKNNIGAFGGDPEKVTICGESAGGYAVSMLCASPLAKRLFSGAISQSGGSFGPLKTLKQAETDGKSFTQNAGASSIKELREMDAEKLPMGWYVGNAWPIIDKHVILDDQYKLYEAGKYNDIPVLIGYNSDDGEMFMRTHNPKEYIASVEEQYEKFADTLLKVYPLADNTIPKTARDLVRDAMFGWHTWSWARLQAQTGKTKVF